MLVGATSSRGRLPLGLLAVCFLEGTFTGAFFVGALLPFPVSWIFSGGSFSSPELLVKLQLDVLELDGVAAFRFSAFAGFAFFASFANLSSSFSFASDFFNTSMSFPLETAGDGVAEILETLLRLDVMCISNCVGVPGCASPSTF